MDNIESYLIALSLIIFNAYVLKSISSDANKDKNMESIRKNFDLEIKQNDEKDIKIKELYLYPIRGVKGIKVKSAEVGPLGLKYDRYWTIINVKKMTPCANHNDTIVSFLR